MLEADEGCPSQGGVATGGGVVHQTTGLRTTVSYVHAPPPPHRRIMHSTSRPTPTLLQVQSQPETPGEGTGERARLQNFRKHPQQGREAGAAGVETESNP